MKIINIGKWLLMGTLCSTLNANVYEDAEDASTKRWTISDNTPKNATFKNVYDDELKSRIIQLSGKSYENQYMIGNFPDEEGSWNESEGFYLSWNMKNTEGFLIDVLVQTEQGLRYIRYSDDDIDQGIDDELIQQGIGYDASNGKWQKFTRNLKLDLEEFDPDNKLLSVHGLLIRGNCKFDNIELKSEENPQPIVEEKFTIYEDGEDEKISRWSISDNEPAGATVTNVLDSIKNSQVIKFSSVDSYENQYSMDDWNNNKELNLKWDMKTTEGFIIDIVVSSELGERYLRYIDDEESHKGIIDDEVIYHGLGNYPTDGNWHTFIRNLQKDLVEFEPNNKLLKVNSFNIRANASIDNIELFSSLEKVYEDGEDKSNHRWRHYSGEEGATIKNLYDNDKKSQIISLTGNSYGNQYIIGGDLGDNEAWHNTKHSNLKWSMQNSDGFILYVNVNTSNGIRYLKYFDGDFSEKNIDGDELYYGLGYNASNGNWHTYIRDLSADLKEFEPENKLLSVEGLIIIGSANLDDLELFSTLHPINHKAGLALTFDDYAVDGWFSMNETFLEYGVKPTFFVSNFHELSEDKINKLKTLENNGAEIACHTYSHEGINRDYHNNIDRINEYINAQIIPAFENMKAAGFNPKSLAYPYGEHQKEYDEAVREYFPYLRTTASDHTRKLYQLDEIFHQKGKNYNILAGDGIDSSYNNEIEEIKEAFIKARKNQEIITLYGHEVDSSDNIYAVSPEKLTIMVEMAKNLGLEFYTFKEAYLLGQ